MKNHNEVGRIFLGTESLLIATVLIIVDFYVICSTWQSFLDNSYFRLNAILILCYNTLLFTYCVILFEQDPLKYTQGTFNFETLVVGI